MLIVVTAPGCVAAHHHAGLLADRHGVPRRHGLSADPAPPHVLGQADGVDAGVRAYGAPARPAATRQRWDSP